MPKPLTVWITTSWKIFKEMGIPDHLTCLLGNPYAGQEATVRTRHGKTEWFQGCILSPCLFNLYAENIMWNVRLDEAQAGIKIALEPQICRWHHPYGRNGRTKEPLDESERGEWQSWLKTQKTKVITSGSIPLWQIGEGTVETVTDFSWTPKSLQMVTAVMKLKDACCLEEKLWPTYTACWKAETLLY